MILHLKVLRIGGIWNAEWAAYNSASYLLKTTSEREQNAGTPLGCQKMDDGLDVDRKIEK